MLSRPMDSEDRSAPVAPSLSPGRPRARREKPMVRRQDLLAVTVACLARLGAKGTTGREICRQAGVSHSLLRHYFDNPDDLLLETYQHLCDQFVAGLERDVAAAGDDPWVALDRVFALHFSDEWAGPDILGAWIAFWTLVRARDDFAVVRDGFNARVQSVMRSIVARLPTQANAPAIADSVAILGGVMDGLWLDYGLARDPGARSRGIALCNQAARRLLSA